MRRVWLIAFAVAAPAFAQEFEAATVKMMKPPEPIDGMRPESVMGSLPVMKGGPGTATPTRIRYTNVNLIGVLMKAYDVYRDQIVGPDWMKDQRYLIEGVVPEGATKEQFLKMLQKLVAARFRLEFGWEEREFKVYRLAVAKDGPKLKKSAVVEDEDAWDNPLYSQIAGAKSTLDSRGCPVLPPEHKAAFGRNNCMSYVGHSIADLGLTLGMHIANETGSNFGPRGGWAHVVDETGLSGRFDFALQYDPGYYVRLNAPNFPEAMRPSADRKPASIFKAVETQLGLKLERATAKLKVMAIRRVERTPVEE